jgi:hypothetical protein
MKISSILVHLKTDVGRTENKSAINKMNLPSSAFSCFSLSIFNMVLPLIECVKQHQ